MRIEDLDTNLTTMASHNFQVENVVLGAILQDRAAFAQAAKIIRAPESFYDRSNQNIYRAVQVLYRQGFPIDLVTTASKLREMGLMGEGAGKVMEYMLVEKTNMVSSADNIEHHAIILQVHYLKRSLLAMANKLAKDVSDDASDPKELIDALQKEIYELMSSFSGGKGRSVGDGLMELTSRMKVLLDSGGEFSGVTSGMEAVDAVTDGWQDSDLIILAARPGMGKTSLALAFLKNAAEAGTAGAFFSLEMSMVQLVMRFVSMETGISTKKLRSPKMLNDLDWKNYNSALESLSELPIFIDDTPGITLLELSAKARQFKVDHDIGFIALDYLQLMSGSGAKNVNRENEVSDISRGLKRLAKELDIPVIALSQLNRLVETRGGDKRPKLHDLRESGGIEQDADVVAFLYRPEYYGKIETDEGQSLKGVAEVIFAKHRHGALDTVFLKFEEVSTLFRDLLPEEVYEDIDLV